MYRPWDEDSRPAWKVTTTWGTPRGYHDEVDQELLLKTLEETGHVRRQSVETVYGQITLTMLVRADSRDAAEQAAVRIGEVAYHAAGLGPLGQRLDSMTVAHPPSGPGRW
jgi:hypothetical protein